MLDADHCRLLFGPYKTPVFKYGDIVICERRGQVEIVGLSGGRIPWPVGKRRGAKAIVLCGALKRAVRLESAVAVAYWWGVTPQTVTIWRRALAVLPSNAGTKALKGRILAWESGERMRELARLKDRDPDRRAKIAAAKRGKCRPGHVVEAMRAGTIGRVQGEEERRKRSKTHKRRGTRPPTNAPDWTDAEDELVRTLPAAEAARRTGRGLGAVYPRRHLLGVPDGRRRE
jgi:hypothetical protein